ncbi:MAG: sulfite exporter TauE/SafE family protein [Pseudomonadota bacterium]
MAGPEFWTLAVIAAFCVGLSKGGAPSFGALAVPILSLSISPIAAAGLLLPVFLFSDIFGVATYRRYANWAVLRIAAIGIVIGTGIGWATAHLVSDTIVRILIGVIGVSFALNFIRMSGHVRAERAPGRTAGLFWSGVAGFTSFVSHSGAPPWQVWAVPLGLPKMVFAGTSTFAFALMNVLKIGPYWALGQLSLGNLWTGAILFVPAIAGVLTSYVLIQRLPTRVFYGIVTWALLAVSLKLLWDGIAGL